MKKRFVRVFALVLALSLLCACGAEYEVTVIDENGEHAETMKKGAAIPDGSLVYTEDGDVFRAEGYKLRGPVRGIIYDAPEKTVMDAAHLAEAALDEGRRVMLIYIDGLGWQSFEDAVADGAVPCLAGLSYERAASVYPTITPVNYAAMVTGQPPKTTGVTKRGIHQLSCASIFDYAAEKGLTSFASEGDTQILALSNTVLELSPDLNGSGTGDDEIFGLAMENRDAYDLVFVHFHSVDDAEHENGPGSAEARQALEQVDEWCAELMDGFDGLVIVTADHGQHEQDGTGDTAYADRKGTHGDFAVSDIFVPIMTN